MPLYSGATPVRLSACHCFCLVFTYMGTSYNKLFLYRGKYANESSDT